MTQATVTTKGQVTIPKAIRERLGLQPGDELEFIEDRSGLRIRKLVRESPFDEWRGYLKHMAGKDPDAVVEEMRGQ